MDIPAASQQILQVCARKDSARGSVQVEMDPNLAEFQCFVTPMLLQVCVHGLQWSCTPMPGPTAVSALRGLNPFTVSGVVLDDFPGVSPLLVPEEMGKITNVLGNSLSS